MPPWRNVIIVSKGWGSLVGRGTNTLRAGFAFNPSFILRCITDGRNQMRVLWDFTQISLFIGQGMEDHSLTALPSGRFHQICRNFNMISTILDIEDNTFLVCCYRYRPRRILSSCSRIQPSRRYTKSTNCMTSLRKILTVTQSSTEAGDSQEDDSGRVMEGGSTYKLWYQQPNG
jgi:hypothetical protein